MATLLLPAKGTSDHLERGLPGLPRTCAEEDNLV
jgi:hypothetical protein